MREDQNKIELVFEELKSKKLLSLNRKLRSSRLTPNFRSAIIFYNTINYNPKFCEMQEENIRFSLLHEEGHKIKPQYGPPCLFFISIFAFIPTLLVGIFYSNQPIFVFSSLIYSILFVMIVLAMLRESFHYDEFDFDIFAAEILRDSYGIRKPSYTLYNTLRELHSIIRLTYQEEVTIFEKIEIC